MSQRTLQLHPSHTDFYQRKIRRLEQDNTILHDQLTNTRMRLRSAQDFQIKYQVLLKTSQRQIQSLKTSLQNANNTHNQQVVRSRLGERDKQWTHKMIQMQNRLAKNAEEELKRVRNMLDSKEKELEELRRGVDEMKGKIEQMQLFGFKLNSFQKQNDGLRQRLAQSAQYMQGQKNKQLGELRNHLTTAYRQKITTQKQHYQQVIAQLQKKLNQLQIQKDNQTFRPSNEANRQLLALRELVEQKSSEHEEEVEKLNAALAYKNTQIAKILQEAHLNQQRYRSQIAQKRQMLSQLQDKLIQTQKTHLIQVSNLIQRNNTIAKQQTQALIQKINQLYTQLQQKQHQNLTRKINYEEQLDEARRDFEEQRRRMKEDGAGHKKRVSDLSIRMREMEKEREDDQTRMLINSFKELESKEDQLSNYQNGIVFLERQIKKLQLKLQQKTRVIAKLHKDINQLRSQTDKQLADAKGNHRRQKQQSTLKISQLQSKINDLQDRLRNGDRLQRKRDRDILHKQKQLQTQNEELKELVEQLQRDYNRVVQGKKGVEGVVRQERQKNTTHRLDTNTVKKQKWLQLQKQKQDLDLIYKQKQQQTKIRYQKELDQLNNKYMRLQQDHQLQVKNNQILSKDMQILREEYSVTKESNKMADYNKQMASLNLELALTQNLYEELIRVKGKAFEQIQESSQEQSFGDIKVPSQQTPEEKKFRVAKTMSFNPYHQ